MRFKNKIFENFKTDDFNCTTIIFSMLIFSHKTTCEISRRGKFRFRMAMKAYVIYSINSQEQEDLFNRKEIKKY